MGAVVCFGCREELDSCACNQLDEQEVAERLAEGECCRCHAHADTLFEMRYEESVVYVCALCVPRKCRRCNRVRPIIRPFKLCVDCTQEETHWS